MRSLNAVWSDHHRCHEELFYLNLEHNAYRYLETKDSFFAFSGAALPCDRAIDTPLNLIRRQADCKSRRCKKSCCPVGTESLCRHLGETGWCCTWEESGLDKRPALTVGQVGDW